MVSEHNCSWPSVVRPGWVFCVNALIPNDLKTSAFSRKHLQVPSGIPILDRCRLTHGSGYRRCKGIAGALQNVCSESCERSVHMHCFSASASFGCASDHIASTARSTMAVDFE